MRERRVNLNFLITTALLSFLLLLILLSYSYDVNRIQSGANFQLGPSAEEGLFEKLARELFGSDIVTPGFKNSVATILLSILLIMLVYSVVGFIPFVEKEGVKWVVSIIVGILGFMFMSKLEILSILQTYQALGVVLTAFLPILIIGVFLFKLQIDRRSAVSSFGRLIHYPVWFIFLFYLGYKLLSVWSGNPTFRWWYVIAIIGGITFMVSVPRLAGTYLNLLAARWEKDIRRSMRKVKSLRESELEVAEGLVKEEEKRP